MTKRGAPWSAQEIEPIVADYFVMLEYELAGRAYVKAEHNRALQKVIDRSRLAIERKHQNISAVLVALGLPSIKGYKPLANYQQALFDAIEARIDRSNIQDRMSTRPYATNPQLNRLVRKFDPARRDARARALGEAGEAFLYQAEQDRLARLYDFSRTRAAFQLKPPLTDHVRLAASQYRATF